MHTHLSNNKLFAPLYFWLIYSITTIIIFEFGPLQFPIDNKFILYLYLSLAHIAIAFGYYRGFKKFNILRKYKYPALIYKRKWLNIITLLAFISIILSFVGDFIGGASVSVALDNPFESRDLYSNRSGGPMGYLISIINIFRLPFIAIATINYRSLNKTSRFVLFFMIFRIVYESFIGSSRSGLMLLIVLMFFSVLSLIYKRHIKLSIRKFFLLGTILLVGFLGFASYISVARVDTSATSPIEDMVEYMSNNPRYEFSEENIFVPKLPENLGLLNAGLLTGYFYFTHAYAGLSNAINMPFIGTSLFFGHSDFTIRNLERIFGSDVLKYSYNYRLIEQGSSSSTLWITAYAWIASDITFFGSFFLLYFFGYLYASTWIKSLTNPTVISSALFGWMAYFFFQINVTFVPADLGAFISFWGCILIYMFRFKDKARIKNG